MSFERCPDPVWLSGGTLNHLVPDQPDTAAEPAGDLADRIVAVLDAAGVDGPVSADRIRRLLARDGVDVATSVVRETCGALAGEGRLVEAAGPRYALPD